MPSKDRRQASCVVVCRAANSIGLMRILRLEVAVCWRVPSPRVLIAWSLKEPSMRATADHFLRDLSSLSSPSPPFYSPGNCSLSKLPLPGPSSYSVLSEVGQPSWSGFGEGSGGPAPAKEEGVSFQNGAQQLVRLLGSEEGVRCKVDITGTVGISKRLVTPATPHRFSYHGVGTVALATHQV